MPFAIASIIPYVVWMVLMAALPSTAAAYAIRSFATLATAAVCYGYVWKRPETQDILSNGQTVKLSNRQTIYAVLAGVVVWALWVFPERFEFYRQYFIIGEATSSGPSPYSPEVCGWPLTLIRLFGSAFVIATVEEIFFRGFLYRYICKGDWRKTSFDLQAFAWVCALFALEHNRILAAILAGAVYSLVSIRYGLKYAIYAHITTNLILGLQVIFFAQWSFW